MVGSYSYMQRLLKQNESKFVVLLIDLCLHITGMNIRDGKLQERVQTSIRLS